MVNLILDDSFQIAGKPIEDLTQEEIVANLQKIHKVMCDHLSTAQDLRSSQGLRSSRNLCCSLNVSFYKVTKSGIKIAVTARPNSEIIVTDTETQEVICKAKEI